MSVEQAIEIREAVESDLPAILAIHNDEVLNGTALWSIRPVDLADRAALLADRRARNYPFLVGIKDETLLGYASFGPFRPHEGYDRTVEHSIYVHRDHRRRGVARRLLPPLIESARALRKHVMIGGVDATNTGSVELHRAFGFEPVATLPQVGFKFGRYLDLTFMQKILDDGSPSRMR